MTRFAPEPKLCPSETALQALATPIEDGHVTMLFVHEWSGRRRLHTQALVVVVLVSAPARLFPKVSLSDLEWPPQRHPSDGSGSVSGRSIPCSQTAAIEPVTAFHVHGPDFRLAVRHICGPLDDRTGC